ncbi:MAG: molybdopterin-guanine dinucleotide biosynthesis protein B [bacterium]
MSLNNSIRHPKSEIRNPKIVSIIGPKGSGKTTLIKGLIKELNRRGYRVGTIKHYDCHLDLKEVEKPGKDTFHHLTAGAERVVLAGPAWLTLARELKKEMGLNEICQTYLQGLDLVLTEGYKGEDKPKIEVFRSELYQQPLSKPGDDLVALVSDTRLDLGVTCFEPTNYKGLADLLEKKFIWHDSKS